MDKEEPVKKAYDTCMSHFKSLYGDGSEIKGFEEYIDVLIKSKTQEFLRRRIEHLDVNELQLLRDYIKCR
jgi:hypothetical protein